MDKKLSGGQAENARQNLILMRRKLKLSQREFIERYLTGPGGKKMFSVSTLSSIENGTSGSLKLAVSAVAERILQQPELFLLGPEEFAVRMDGFFKKELGNAPAGGYDISGLIKKSSTVEGIIRDVSDYITDGILSGEMKPGDKLPSDRDLAGRFGVSRSAMREAMKVLAAMGLVNILHGQGTFIARDDTNFFLAPLSWTFLLGNRNIRNILMVRNMLECASAREAAGRRAAGEDFGLLQQAYEKTCAAAEAQDLTAFIDNDVLFHLAIAKLCGNPIIESLLNTIRRITRYISSTGLMTAQQMEDSHREHREVYTAVMEGDQAGAEAAMAKHIHNATSRYKDYPEC